MSAAIAATVLVPTTGEKGPVIRHTLASVLAQSVASIEVFVIGDGAGDSTRAVAQEIARADSRVRFFDYPKSERRGEPYRHDLLTREARGRIVCYLCDRDLWCADHVESLLAALGDAEFATALTFCVRDQGEAAAHFRLSRYDLRIPAHRGAFLQRHLSAGPLSAVAHTLAMYRRLPNGWETTPRGLPTDQIMWSKFLREPECRFAYSRRPTVLTFREAFWTEDAQRREPALAWWANRIRQDDWRDRRWELIAETLTAQETYRGVWFQAQMPRRAVVNWFKRTQRRLLGKES